MTTFRIEYRRQVLVNTDPQRRCYHGVHARSELMWTEWDPIDFGIGATEVEERLEWWRALNASAVAERGSSAARQFRAVAED